MVVGVKQSRRRQKPHPQAGRSVLSGREAYLWALYKSDRSLANRNQLVEFYLPLLGVIAGKLAQRIPMPQEELESDGTIGLIWAVEHFEPDRGLRFATYASRRIHGAIIDALRERDPVSRLYRAKAARLQAALEQLECRHGRPPTDRQLARALGIKIAELAKFRADAEMGKRTACSLDVPLYELRSNRGTTGNMLLVDHRSVNHTSEWWAENLKGLDVRQRLILLLYYREDWTMKRIAASLGVSESRVSQMHQEIVALLKATRDPADFADISSRRTC